jgi:hypothetical protein
MRDRHRVGQPTWIVIRNCHDVGRPSRVHFACSNRGKNVDRKEEQSNSCKPWYASSTFELPQGASAGFESQFVWHRMVSNETARPTGSARRCYDAGCRVAHGDSNAWLRKLK